jgi:cleavage and polyadenylation specificity factor subunit 1
MYAIHQTVLPPSAIHHSLFLPNLTPSTIYPLPQSHNPDAPQIKVAGNLIVAGGNDLRVFEVRESQVPLLSSSSRKSGVNGTSGNASDEEGEIEEGMEEDFYDIGHAEVYLFLCSPLAALIFRQRPSSSRQKRDCISWPLISSTGLSLV